MVAPSPRAAQHRRRPARSTTDGRSRPRAAPAAGRRPHRAVAYAKGRAEQRPGGGSPERDDQPRLHDRDLAVEPRRACSHLDDFGLGVDAAVRDQRVEVLDGVGDVHVVGRDARGLHRVAQRFPAGPTNGWPSRFSRSPGCLPTKTAARRPCLHRIPSASRPCRGRSRGRIARLSSVGASGAGAESRLRSDSRFSPRGRSSPDLRRADARRRPRIRGGSRRCRPLGAADRAHRACRRRCGDREVPEPLVVRRDHVPGRALGAHSRARPRTPCGSRARACARRSPTR